jgi:hypothetical protein
MAPGPRRSFPRSGQPEAHTEAMGETDLLVTIARDELGHAGRLLDAHIRQCSSHGCSQCRSLARHVSRCERQAGLLAGRGEAAEPALF